MDSSDTPAPVQSLANYTSFALLSAMLIFTSLHVLLDIDIVAASYPVPEDVVADDLDDTSTQPLHTQVFRAITVAALRWTWHLKFMLQLSFRILGTLALLAVSAMLLMAVCNRFIVGVATERGDQPIFSYKHDPAIQMTTLFAITKHGMGMLISMALAHMVVMLSSVVLIRPGNMKDLDKEVRPKLKMYLSIMFMVTILVIITETIRIATP
jgi:hypothetical protein